MRPNNSLQSTSALTRRRVWAPSLGVTPEAARDTGERVVRAGPVRLPGSSALSCTNTGSANG